MTTRSEQHLSRRERQIMDVIYAKQQASALEVMAALPDPPGKTAVRTHLRILEEKGHLAHEQIGQTIAGKIGQINGLRAIGKHQLRPFFFIV